MLLSRAISLIVRVRERVLMILFFEWRKDLPAFFPQTDLYFLVLALMYLARLGRRVETI